MDKIISCEEKIYIFDNNTFWGDKKYKNFISSDITLAGKYIWNTSPTIFKRKENSKNKSNDTDTIYYLEELEDVNGNKITLVIPNDLRPKKEPKTNYEIIGKLITYPDYYSYKIKLYGQLLVEEIKEISADMSYYSKMKQILELRENLLELREKKQKQDIKYILSKEKEKVNFLIIASLKGHNGVKETDILNDVYGNNNQRKYKKKALNEHYNFSTEKDKNIIRTSFSSKEGIVLKIKKKIEEARKNNIIYDYLVFIKGGGQNMLIFNDTEFCNDIINLKIPIITAVGHSDDDSRLLCQLSDIDLVSPTELGKTLISLIFNLKKEEEKEKLEKQLDLTIKKYEDEIKNLNNSINMKKFKLYIALIVIIILIGYAIYATFFINIKDIKKSNPEITNTKVKKEEINNSIASKPKQNEKSKIDNSKKTPTKKLQYSEDEVFTKLLWKGYKGEKAIYDFQKANGMPSTGKVDEALLKKLEIKIKYQ